jgi:ribonuclease HI
VNSEVDASDTAKLYTDGASSGNPGPAGAAFVLLDSAGRTLAERAVPLGRTTVGVAEYRGLITGLTEALALGVKRISVTSDSEFMCRQLQGRYRVRTPAIKPLYDEAKELSRQFESFEICHAGREHNERADALAKQGARMSAERM